VPKENKMSKFKLPEKGTIRDEIREALKTVQRGGDFLDDFSDESSYFREDGWIHWRGPYSQEQVHLPLTHQPQIHPVKGIKLRVTTNPENARIVARIVSLICEKNNIYYKLAEGLAGYKSFEGNVQKGKFAVIFPDVENAPRIAKELDQTLLSIGLRKESDIKTPISDIPIGDSGLVSFRYTGNSGEDRDKVIFHTKYEGKIKKVYFPNRLMRENPFSKLESVISRYILKTAQGIDNQDEADFRARLIYGLMSRKIEEFKKRFYELR